MCLGRWLSPHDSCPKGSPRKRDLAESRRAAELRAGAGDRETVLPRLGGCRAALSRAEQAQQREEGRAAAKEEEEGGLILPRSPAQRCFVSELAISCAVVFILRR